MLVKLLVTALLANCAAAQGYEGRIVGGAEVTPHSIPYVAVVEHKVDASLLCGATIFDNSTVVTGAQCCRGYAANNMQVIAGEHNLTRYEGTEQMSFVTEHIVHEDYSGLSLKNDICLLKLATELRFDAAVQPAQMPTPMQNFTDGTLAQVSGWGSLVYAGVLPGVLYAVDVPLVSDEECREDYVDIGNVADSMICAGETGKDACLGDAGGPLTCNGVFCGIVSWGQGCAEPTYPGVYTEVSYFVDWINANK